MHARLGVCAMEGVIGEVMGRGEQSQLFGQEKYERFEDSH